MFLEAGTIFRTTFLIAAFLGACPAMAQLPVSTDDRGIPTLAQTLDAITPAVVNISVTPKGPSGEGHELDPFFGRRFDLPNRPPRTGAGSGVIVDAEEGYVLTNHHVVQDETEILVTLKDGRRFEAELVGSDPDTDIALVKISASGLTELPLGDSDRLRVGDLVVAIGNPFGLGQTVTSGIISALGRSGLNIEGYEDFIQTDASINPGNSGGALATLDGKLIGINTAILAPTGGNIGIGFAVPINMARAVMEQLIEHGEVRRGRLGVMVQDLTPDLAEALGIQASTGAVVTSVENGSPAQKAGLEAGDVITQVNGRDIRGSADLRTRIGLLPVGSTAEVTLSREGKPVTLRIEVEPASETNAISGAVQRLAGAGLRDIVPGMPMYGQLSGVVVAELEAGSPAARTGLQVGDVITAVNRRPVGSLDEFAAALRESPGAVALDIRRGDARMFLVIR